MKVVATILFVFFILINIVLFWPANLFFLNDDFVHIPLTEKGIFFQTNSIRPVHELLVRFDLLCWGRWAPGYHITALVLHFVVTCQVYQLAKTLSARQGNSNADTARKTALLSVLIFLSYAGYSESLAWIIGRGPILSAIFLLYSLQLSFQAGESRALINQLVGCLCFACALFSYEQALLVPPVLWLLCKKEKTVDSSSQVKYAQALCVVSAIYLVARQVQTSEIMGNYEAGNFRNFNLGILVANAGRFLSRLFINPASRTAYVIALFVLLVMLSTILMATAKRLKPVQRKMVFCGWMIVALLAPMLSLGISTNSFESGRFLYLPSIYLSISISSAAVYLSGSPGLSRMITGAVVFGIVAYWLTGKWEAASAYQAASRYALTSHLAVADHFKGQASVYVVDTLYQNYGGIPVFRSGYKEGISWLHPQIDTSKITILHLVNK
ncbi:hypothetical protein EXU57_04895 [Segetibacter sp. 3557_3]|uniref:hypothetical protein n=1 Tax=Segetibacter sp. 3557_3 TaxID=2547429 RepID=UPI00105846BC|nr:hypothetical protein [Segetibacter sp. 3557_3]TDH27811.1 hypothetical protein EXU57_04895 [Segetibacter sp. 3557_3]